jgi:hypothetical protein
MGMLSCEKLWLCLSLALTQLFIFWHRCWRISWTFLILATPISYISAFRLKIGLFYNSHKKSCTFIWAIQHTEYVDVVTLLQIKVETFQDPYDKGYLPTHLCLMGLAQWLDKKWRLHVREVIPCVHCIQGFGNHFGFGYDDHGCNPQVYHTGIGGRGHGTRGYEDRFDGGHGHEARGTDRADGCPRYPGKLVKVSRNLSGTWAAMLALITTGACLIRIFNVAHANVLATLQRCVICLLRLFFSPNI